MTHRIEIINSETPALRPYINIPQPKWDEIMENDDAAINFGRAVLTKFETIDKDKLQFWRLHKGHKFYVDLKDENGAMKEIISDFLLHGEYEPHTVKLIEKHVKEGDTAVDIGASIGVLTMHLAKAVGNSGKVHAFEPTKNQFEYLKKNIEINGYSKNVEPHNSGAWSAATSIKLKTNLGAEESSDVYALDTILPSKVDFIKVDVDGAEPEVLKGLEQTIIRNPQLKMIIEYYPQYIKNMGLNPQDMLDFLDKYFTYEKVEGDLSSNEYWNYFCTRKS